jgi:hypothetical protein
MMPLMKEKWIDLITLAQRIIVCECCDKIKIEETNVMNHENYMYSLRIALRSVGRRITKVNKYYDKDDDLDLIVYETTITHDEYKIAIDLFDDWVTETHHQFHENEDSDSESEDESEDEKEDDPSV